jgi:hypothetical protein
VCSVSGSYKDVLALQISVHDVLCVYKCDGLGELDCKVQASVPVDGILSML